MRRRNTSLLVILLALSAVLHFFRLSEPRGVVFDEVYFGGFVDAYCCSGQYIFDIHPPHPKLLIAGVAALGGYRGGQRFQDLGEPFTAVSPALLRLVPALAGTLLPALLFVLLLQLGASTAAAFLGGLVVLLDNAVLLQTRIVALDGILLLAGFGSLSCFLAALRTQERLRRSVACLGAGALAGLAAGTKFTGLAALGLIGICLAIEFLRRPDLGRLRVTASQAVWILAGAVGVYMAGWTLHFQLLTEAGPGWAWGVPGGSLLADIVEVHRQMLASNYGLTASHPYSSAWWSWPLMARAVFYWSGEGSALYFLGNPVVWWGTTLGLIVVATNLVLVRITDLRVAPAPGRRLWIPWLGYGISFVPLIPVPRALFLYHYLTPLLFGVCVVLLWLDRVGWTRPGSWRSQRASVHAAVAVLVLGFVAMSPMTFAFLKAPGYQGLLLDAFPSWR